MKKLSVFSAAILSLTISAFTQAQQSASGTGSASAEIQSEDISVEEQQLLDFGRISPFSVDGALTIRASDNRNTPVNIILTETGVRGQWLVTGFPNASFAVSVTNEFTLTSEDGDNTMQVTGVNVGFPNGSTAASSNNITSTTISGTGERSLSVGGRLNVGADQPAGVYNGQYQITVVYN